MSEHQKLLSVDIILKAYNIIIVAIKDSGYCCQSARQLSQLITEHQAMVAIDV